MSEQIGIVAPSIPTMIGEVGEYADVTCATQSSGKLKCHMSKEQLERIQERIAPGSFKHILEKRRASKEEKGARRGAKLWQGLWAAFKRFPIIKQALYAQIAHRALTIENITSTLEGSSRATSEDHNDLRDEYKSSKLSPRDAKKRGIVAMKIPIKPHCPKGYDWKGSDLYSDVESCTDVTDEIKRGGAIPLIMFTSKMPWQKAKSILGNPSMAPLYTKYADDGPIPCTPGTARDSSFHRMKVSLGINLDFIMRSIQGDGYLSWEMKNSCTTSDGEKRTPDDLMFNFGAHIFEPLMVDVDGRIEEHTLMISTVAVASTSIFRKIIPKRVPYQRFIGGGFAKMLLLEAEQKGWRIESE